MLYKISVKKSKFKVKCQKYEIGIRQTDIWGAVC